MTARGEPTRPKQRREAERDFTGPRLDSIIDHAHVLAKLNLSSRVEAAVFAVENRLGPPGGEKR